VGPHRRPDRAGPGTRIAILRAKAEEQAVPVNSDVLEFIARKVVSNIRELEGALNRIVAYAAWARYRSRSSWLRRFCRTSSTTPRSVSHARANHSRGGDYYGVQIDALKGQKRDKAIVVPRQIAMFLMREETDVSLLRIGPSWAGGITPPSSTPATRSTARWASTTSCGASWPRSEN